MPAHRCRPARRLKDVEHVTVYRGEDEFCAWPFNCGFWKFPDGELLVGFDRAPCDYATAEQAGHARIADASERVLARSYDRGATWPAKDRIVHRKRSETYALLTSGRGALPRPEPMDFTAPDFCMMSGFGVAPQSHPGLTCLEKSADRGATWASPQMLPTHRFMALFAKDIHLVLPDGMILLFASASYQKDFGYDAFPVVYASTDQGVSWVLMSFIGPGNRHYTMVYPDAAMLPSGRILASVRCQVGSAYSSWTEAHASDDGGKTWGFLSRVNAFGAPGPILCLNDGRVLCVYGYRVPPYGLRARISKDQGKSWGPEWIVREDGGSWDLGYPRIAQIDSRRAIAVYYFNDRDDPVQQDGGVRYIAASVFAVP